MSSLVDLHGAGTWFPDHGAAASSKAGALRKPSGQR